MNAELKQTKACSCCGEVKPLTGFYVNRGVERHSVCKPCRNRNRVESRERHRGRYMARAKVNNAIAAGMLIRQSCEVCGDPQTHAHHDDYSKPLTVRWLCRPHHQEWHNHNEAKE